MTKPPEKADAAPSLWPAPSGQDLRDLRDNAEDQKIKGTISKDEHEKHMEEVITARIRYRAYPDWEHWLQIRKAYLWQLVALSCGIDPKRLEYKPAPAGQPIYTEVRGSVGTEFGKRLEIAIGHLGVDGGLDTVQSGIGNREASEVLLESFVAWAKQMDWDLPLELQEESPNERALEGQPDTKALKRSVPKDDVVFHFCVKKDENANRKWWDQRMRSAKRYKLADCRASLGRGRKQAMYYPVNWSC
jgi:hypothetical protein